MAQEHDFEVGTVTRALHRLHVLIATAMGDQTSGAGDTCEQCAAQAEVAVGALERAR